jgi:rhamnogalacturonan endolyase
MKHKYLLLALLLPFCLQAQRQMEFLDRGFVAFKTANGINLSWRLMGNEFNSQTAFNIYRNGTKLNAVPLSGATYYMDASGSQSMNYSLKMVVNGVEQTPSVSTTVWAQNWMEIPLQIPAGGTTVSGEAYTYSPNDCSTGDVDGDGQLEIILKWDPSNAKDNSQAGYTGNVFLDCYKLNGQRLWRIDLGKNIRAGAHYTQFQVYDYDGDGKAEVACKTADGTIDGTGQVIGMATADHRNTNGYILQGAEYLTVFSGLTGRILHTIPYDPPRGSVGAWGDTYGNRVDRFLACTAYLDGKKPALVMCRGYYTRTVLVAYDFINNQLVRRWKFDTDSLTNGAAYRGQGNHNLAVVDVDDDGKDEIVYGAMTVDDNGAPLYTTNMGHGDAIHVSDLDPSRPGLEVWGVHETGTGATFRSAKTGDIYFRFFNTNDIGRGCAADITAAHKGAEMWCSGSPLYNAKGDSIGRAPSRTNHLIWWDGDDLRELLDANSITKFGVTAALETAVNCVSNNTTKSNPCLQADLFGDWREEVIWRTSDNTKLRIYTTPFPTTRRLFTLMHDYAYRLGIAWQNTAYNQPPHTSFYIGDGMTDPLVPNINILKNNATGLFEKAILPQNSLKIYPNPTKTGFVTVELPDNTPLSSGAVSIMDTAGKLVFQQKMSEQLVGNTPQNINVSALSAGNYVVQVTTGQTVWSGRLVKN